jgi:hypothetical protein
MEISVLDQELNIPQEFHLCLKNGIEKCEKRLGIDRTFEACIHIDIMQGQSNKKAREYRKQKKKVSDQ